MVPSAIAEHAKTRAAGGGARDPRADLRRRLGEIGDRLEIATRDGVRLLKDRAAMGASTGRAQVERGQDYVSFHARRRPLLVTGVAASLGVLLGLLLRAGLRAGGSDPRARGGRPAT